MSTVDLDVARIARAEKRGESPTVKFRGETFELPDELPFEIVDGIGQLGTAQKGNDGARAAEIVADIARSLFCDRYEEFLKLGPSMADVAALLDGVVAAYGTSLGESEASES